MSLSILTERCYAYRPFVLSVVVLNVLMLSVVALLETTSLVVFKNSNNLAFIKGLIRPRLISSHRSLSRGNQLAQFHSGNRTQRSIFFDRVLILTTPVTQHLEIFHSLKALLANSEGEKNKIMAIHCFCLTDNCWAAA
jgi:hypothetical protein